MTDKTFNKAVEISDIAAILLCVAGCVALVGWLSAGTHKAQVANAPTVTEGNTQADKAAATLAPGLVSFTTDDPQVREMVVVVVGNDNSSRLMTFTKSATPAPVLYKMAASLLDQGADSLNPTDKPREEHQL